MIYPLKPAEDKSTKFLDNMIKVEEDQTGYSMFNRGKSLKRSLIDPERVKKYLRQLKEDRELENFAQDQID